MPTRFILCCLLAAFIGLHRKPTFACPVCIAYPQKSAADVLIESPCIVFAREDPDRPLSYAAVEVLKGSADSTPIDLFVDSRTRRMLATYPDRVVVLARDGKDGGWRNLGIADATYAAIVRRIAVFAPRWQGPEGNQRRVEFFLQFFGHENRLIFELAYLELARASYDTIKRLGHVVPREQIEPVLRSRSYVQWRGLAILMLAQTGEPNDEQYIVRSFRLAERFGLTKDLAAWATAAIELEGAEAVSFVERRYFRQPDRKQEELVEVVKALSLHGTEGRTDLRDQIVVSYAALLDIHPQMSEYVAKDLAAWKRTELSQRLSEPKLGHRP
jgi:hypothetical protein